MNRRFFLQGMGATVLASSPISVFSASSPATKEKQTAFSVMDVFDSDAMRAEVRQRVASFDASAYINEAVRYALTHGYQTIYLPSGTYILSGQRTGLYDAILFARSHLTILGDGQGSILKVADNYTNGGDYRVLAPIAEEDINNFSVRNVHFDGNAKHNLVLSSFEQEHIRRTYSINILSGSDIRISECWFSNNPGRGVINLGNNASAPSMSNVVIQNNVIANVGGSIKGNRQQNDHSSIYLQADGATVANNRFYNDAPVDPFTAPKVTVVALEIHGRNTHVTANDVENYSTGGNAVAQVQNSENNVWSGNKFHNLTSLGLTLWSVAPYQNKNLVIKDNTFHIDNSVYTGNTAIFQNPLPGATTSQIKNLLIENNIIYSTINARKMATWHGISLCAVDGAIIRGNKIQNIQGCGINLEESVAVLGVNDVNIYENEIINVGLHRGANRVWAIRVSNPDAKHLFARINIHDNIMTGDKTDGHMRGILIDGDQQLMASVGTGNRFSRISSAQRAQLIIRAHGSRNEKEQ